MIRWSDIPKFLTIIFSSPEDIDSLQKFILSLKKHSNKYIFLDMPLQESSSKNLSEALESKSSLQLVEYRENDSICEGKIYFATDSYIKTKNKNSLTELLLETKTHLGLDAPFHIIGIILSGNSSNIVPTITALKEKSAYILVQEPETSTIPHSPELIIGKGLSDAVLELDEIPSFLKKLTQGKIKLPESHKIDIAFSQQLIENLQGIFFLFNKEGKMLLWNKAVKEVTQYTDKEISEMHPVDFFPDAEREMIQQKIKEAFETGSASVEANIKNKANNLTTFLFKASYAFFQNEPCLYGIGIDISIQKESLFEINMMLNNTDEAFILTDESLKIISFNKKFADKSTELYGKKVEKFDSLLDYATEEEKQSLVDIHKQVLQGESITVEFELQRGKGRKSVYEFTHKPAKNEKGKILGVFISAKDITSEKQSKLKLEESERKLHTLVREGSDLIAILDAQGKYKFTSPNHLQYLGYTEQELLDTSAFELIHPDDLEEIKFKFQSLLSKQRVTTHPYRVKHKEFGWRWVQSTANYLIDDPAIQGALINSTDITDLVNIQKKLEAGNELFHYVQKASNDAIFDWDIVKDEFEWSESFTRVFGHDFQLKRFRLEDWISFIHPIDAAKEKNRWDQFLADKELFQWINEFRFKDSKGDYLYVEEVAYLLRDESGKPKRMIGSLRDISHQKQEIMRNKLLSDIGIIFKKNDKTTSALKETLTYLAEVYEAELAEVWMVPSHKKYIRLYQYLENSEETRKFYISEKSRNKFEPGEGIPGKVWKSQIAISWNIEEQPELFVRTFGNEHLKLISAICIPLFYNVEVVGVLLLGNKNPEQQKIYYKLYLKPLEEFLGAEIKKKQQEEELNQFFENAPDLLAVADKNGKFRKVNPAFTKLLGYTAEELTTRPFVDFLHPDDLRSTNKEYRETVSGLRKAENFINRYRTISGDYKWISWKSSEPFGEESFVYAFGRDVTDRIKLNILLENANQLAQLGGWELNLENNSVYWSKITRSLHEVPSDFIPDIETGYKFYKEGFSREQIQKAIEACISKGTPFDLELTIITYKGNEKWVRVIGKAEKIGGKVVKLSGSFQDISERKNTELELKRSNERFEKASLATQDAIWDYDLIENKLYWTQGYQTLFGYNLPGQNGGEGLNGWLDKIHPNYRKNVHESLQLSLEDPEVEFWKTEYKYQKADGNYAVVEDRGLIVRNENGIAIRMVGAISDISQRKDYENSLQKLNKSLQKQAKELEISNAELEQFAYIASHDLQEPLRMVSSFLGQLEKKYKHVLDDKAKQYIHFAVDGSKRMRQIILDLLDYSRVGKHDDDHQEIDLNALVEEVFMVHRKSIEDTSAEISIADLPKIKGPKTPIFQVFHNLINNAFKYSKDDIPLLLKITTEEKEDHWEFCIKDNGIGIEKEYYDRIFIIFHRLHGKEKYQGTGMGLSLVKKIIETLNGKIWVDSKYGEGTAFYFTLPKTPK
ncbi:multi-sensor signal transduction histidine kinase [Indibacter alkaliphilus LW1]|uniref:histidine kinase n=1 Tax=Indibacter alkaliphilus (strain CCUG 57479 / KCTC 22604 / LW1) TaxID=1189612 RepID=S2DED2_INDAL|nr:PAS domain S-box protein [Indibacter alkaliphilus]EOZ95365.1 multi-sensor signal transduction histidine kinase [Indibacter alkaliphilus LW1]